MFDDLEKDLRSLRGSLSEMQRNLFDLRPSMPEIKQVLIRSVERNFQEGGRYQVIGNKQYTGGTQRWKPSKRARRTGGITLQDSGALAAAVNAQTGSDFILLSAARIYAAAQHYGAKINHPGGTPYILIGGRAKFLRKDGEYPPGVRFTRPHIIELEARPFLVIQIEDVVEIGEIVSEDLSRRR
jgi:phage gpG-like protein